MPIFRKTLWVSVTVGFVASLLLWLAVTLNGEVVPGQEPAYVRALLTVQQPGTDAAHRWFPCTEEGSTKGCEVYKTVPATIFVNGIVLAGVLLIPIYFFRLWSTSLD